MAKEVTMATDHTLKPVDQTEDEVDGSILREIKNGLAHKDWFSKAKQWLSFLKHHFGNVISWDNNGQLKIKGVPVAGVTVSNLVNKILGLNKKESSDGNGIDTGEFLHILIKALVCQGNDVESDESRSVNDDVNQVGKGVDDMPASSIPKPVISFKEKLMMEKQDQQGKGDVTDNVPSDDDDDDDSDSDMESSPLLFVQSKTKIKEGPPGLRSTNQDSPFKNWKRL